MGLRPLFILFIALFILFLVLQKLGVNLPL